MALKRCDRKILDHTMYKRLIGEKYVFNFVIVLILSSLTTCVSAADMNCASVRYTYEEKGVSVGQVPKDPLSGDHLTVCPQGPTCCTQEMETKLQAQSLREFDRAVRDSLAKVVDIMRVRATRFDEYFKRLLTTSKRDLHEMFRKTYGIIYEQNSEVFTDLFEELEKYYVRGQVDLSVALNNFFSVLYQKMFTVLNAQYRFTDMYLKCVSTHMDDLKPFGDVPRKLSGQLKRSFVATRTYAQALAVAADVASNMLKISPSQDCIRALTKMTGCPACQGLPDLKACNNYCINVMKGCLAFHSELDTEWNVFVDAMDKVAERLLGPFNIEMVVDPINVKISEAIMNFQENGQDISQRVFSGCGKPPLGRRRRGADGNIEYKTKKFGRIDDGLSDMDFNSGTGRLGKVVKDIRQKVKETKKFWSHLPYQICNNDDIAASPTKEDSCWNGEMKARYQPLITEDGIVNQQSNPEVSVDVNHPSSILNEQMSTLQTITSKLKYAFNGEDVTWKVHEPDEIASGGGSGSGDGDDTDDSDDDDDDDDSGSGDGYSYGGGRNTIGSGIPSNPYGPGDRNDVHLGGSGSGLDRHRPKNATSGFDGGMKRPELSVTRAVTSYLLPIVVMWFGGIFTEWL